MAKYLDSSFKLASSTVCPGSLESNSSYGYNINLNQYLPQAKIGRGNYIYIWSQEGINWFGLSQVTIVGSGMQSFSNMSVIQAYQIDKKMDDGLPQTGHVQALYWTNSGSAFFWGGGVDTGGYNTPSTASTPGTASTCFDNGGGSGAQQYSVEQNGGTGLNCALSFQFQ